jgi:hypothetical protein
VPEFCAQGMTSGSASYSDLGEGRHRFEVQSLFCIDTCGPPGATAAYEWVVDTTPPDTRIVGGPHGPSTSTTVTLEFAASDHTATYQCRLDGASFAACRSPHEISGIPVGVHQAEVRGIDPAGNVETTHATWDFEVEPDGDGDTVADARDNCRTTANRDQADSDGNGIGNACEPDSGASVPGPAGGPPTTAPGQPAPAAPTPAPPTRPTTTRREAGRIVIPFRSGFRLPPGLRRREACRGRVRVALRVGRRVLAVQTVRLNRRCRYAATFTIRAARLRGARTVTVVARFRGNAVLGAAGRAYLVRIPA